MGLSVGIVVLVCGVAAVVLVLTGGKPSARARDTQAQATQLTNVLLAQRQLYVAARESSYVVLLPAGWTPTSAQTPGLASAVTVNSPIDTGASITVGQVSHGSARLADAGGALRKLAAQDPSFQQTAAGPTTVPGGRPAWQLAYQATGTSHVLYVLRSCGKEYAVTASVPPTHVSSLRDRIALVAGTLQGVC